MEGEFLTGTMSLEDDILQIEQEGQLYKIQQVRRPGWTAEGTHV